MWIFTQDGFISIVQSRIDENHLIVRARRREDLRAMFPNHTPVYTPDSDYPWRITVLRMVFTAVMLKQFADITYDNFKDQTGGDYHDFLVQVWQRGLDYQDSRSRVSAPLESGPKFGTRFLSSRKGSPRGKQRSYVNFDEPPDGDDA